jgi:hypothetical protein
MIQSFWQTAFVKTSSNLEDPLEAWSESSVIIWQYNSTFYASRNMSTLMVMELGNNASKVFLFAIGNLSATARSIYAKAGTYLIDTEITVAMDDFQLTGEGPSTELRASAAINSILNIKNARFAWINNIFLNGYGLATKCIDASHAPTYVPVHNIENCRVWGATSYGIDLSGCEDVTLRSIWFDGRKTQVDPVVVYTDYGLYVNGGAGNLDLFGCKFMFLEKADAYIIDIREIKFYGALFASKYTYSTALVANVILQGGGTDWVQALFDGCWFDGEVAAKPNILIANYRIESLTLVECEVKGSDAPNIYSTLDPALTSLTILGGRLVRAAGGYHVDVNASNVVTLNTVMATGDGVNLAWPDRYLILDPGVAYLNLGNKIALRNEEGIWQYATNGTLVPTIRLDSDDVLRIFNQAGAGNIEILSYISGGKVKLFNSADAAWLAEFDGNWTRFVTLAGDADTTGWGNSERGQFWFNLAEGRFKYWTGTLTQTMMATNADLGYEVSSYSYLVYTNGTHYFMKSGADGQIKYSSVNASQVLDNAEGNMSDGQTLFIKSGTYNLNGTWKVTKMINIIGEGVSYNSTTDVAYGTILRRSGGVLEISGMTDSRSMCLESIVLDGVDQSGVCLNITEAHVNVRNIVALNGDHGIDLKDCWFSSLYDVVVTKNNIGLRGIEGVNDAAWVNLRAWENDDYGVVLEGGRAIDISGGSFEGNGKWGLVINGTYVQDMRVSGYFENNPHGANDGGHIRIGGPTAYPNTITIESCNLGGFYWNDTDGYNQYRIYMERGYDVTVIGCNFACDSALAIGTDLYSASAAFKIFILGGNRVGGAGHTTWVKEGSATAVVFSPYQTITLGSAVSVHSYVIYEDGGTYYMVNGDDQQVDYSSTNASAVFANVLGNCTGGENNVIFKSGEYNFGDDCFTFAYPSDTRGLSILGCGNVTWITNSSLFFDETNTDWTGGFRCLTMENIYVLWGAPSNSSICFDLQYAYPQFKNVQVQGTNRTTPLGGTAFKCGPTASTGAPVSFTDCSANYVAVSFEIAMDHTELRNCMSYDASYAGFYIHDCYFCSYTNPQYAYDASYSVASTVQPFLFSNLHNGQSFLGPTLERIGGTYLTKPVFTYVNVVTSPQIFGFDGTSGDVLADTASNYVWSGYAYNYATSLMDTGTFASGTNSTAITFSCTFASATPKILCTGTSGEVAAIWVSARSATGFTANIATNTTGSCTFYWWSVIS